MRLKIFLLLFSLLIFTYSTRGGETMWTTTGPYGSFARDIDIHPRNHNILYLTD